MKEYDRSQPLIVIHIPKAAGTTTRQIFAKWFGEGLLLHCYDEANGRPPPQLDLHALHSTERPVVLHGHFNKQRGFGIEERYPRISQFITILRDPFERALSTYFYLRKFAAGWKDQSRMPRSGVRDFLLRTDMSMMDHFPRGITQHNYIDVIETMFIEVGVSEYLHESMRRIGEKLGMNYDPTMLGHLNATERDQSVSVELRNEFIDAHPLRYAIYNYALSKYTSNEKDCVDQPSYPGNVPLRGISSEPRRSAA
jgi:hypothetical protein